MYFQRIGTCGGIGLQPGTVVVTREAVDGTLRPYHDTVSLTIFRNSILRKLTSDYSWQCCFPRSKAGPQSCPEACRCRQRGRRLWDSFRENYFYQWLLWGSGWLLLQGFLISLSCILVSSPLKTETSSLISFFRMVDLRKIIDTFW